MEDDLKIPGRCLQCTAGQDEGRVPEMGDVGGVLKAELKYPGEE